MGSVLAAGDAGRGFESPSQTRGFPGAFGFARDFAADAERWDLAGENKEGSNLGVLLVERVGLPEVRVHFLSPGDFAARSFGGRGGGRVVGGHGGCVGAGFAFEVGFFGEVERVELVFDAGLRAVVGGFACHVGVNRGIRGV